MRSTILHGRHRHLHLNVYDNRGGRETTAALSLLNQRPTDAGEDDYNYRLEPSPRITDVINPLRT